MTTPRNRHGGDHRMFDRHRQLPANAWRIASGCCSHRRVEPTRSVKRNLNVPTCTASPSSRATAGCILALLRLKQRRRGSTSSPAPSRTAADHRTLQRSATRQIGPLALGLQDRSSHAQES
jgi:hypothetical protein